MADLTEWSPRLNIMAMLRKLLDGQVAFFTNAGPPTNGASGTYAARAGAGSLLFDITNGHTYVNLGTLAAPVWANTTLPTQGNGGLGLIGNAKMTYDFAVDGGAIGPITPANSPTLPATAIILGGVVDITTTLTSGGAATIALGLGVGAQVASLKAATAVATWAAGMTGIPLIPIFTSATYVKVAAPTALTLTVAAFALTAGKFDVNIAYLKGNA